MVDIPFVPLPECDEQSAANYGISNDCFSQEALERFSAELHEKAEEPLLTMLGALEYITSWNPDPGKWNAEKARDLALLGISMAKQVLGDRAARSKQIILDHTRT